MNRSIFVCALMLATCAVLGAQQASQSDPYAGVSHPPANDIIVDMTPSAPTPARARKPSPATLAAPQPAPAAAESQRQPSPAAGQAAPKAAPSNLPLGYPGAEPGDGTDDGIVLVEPGASGAPAQRAEPSLNESAYANNPDGDIVHPAPLPPGELGQGTNIRVRLLQSLSTAYDQDGETFRTRVASDVIQDGQVLIPAGSEIDGTVERVSYGHIGGHGSIRLQPETVILPDGSRFHLYAQVFATPGSSTSVTDEGAIVPGSQLKKDSIEYGGAAGAGVATGAILGGPAGALAGGLVGAGVITAHLLLSHPQPSLNSGTALVFSLTRPLEMVPAGHSKG